MGLRFDHAAIAVRDLPAALGVYRDVLGLDARPGGRHTGRGTENAIIRFEPDYLELMAVYDARAEVAAAGQRGQVLVDYLTRREGGLVGYCLATDEVEVLARRLRASGLALVGPVAVERVRPDGQVLRWRLIWPGGVNWRRPWPFFIQAAAPAGAQPAFDPPGDHPLGATGVAGVAVAVFDLERGKDLYGRQLGLGWRGEDLVPELAARRARFGLGNFAIDLLAPTGAGLLQAELDEVGEGPFELRLRVQSLERARAWLDRSGVRLGPAPRIPGGRLIPPDQALGARLILTE